jgi:Protein of unknown function (DUF2630)
VSSDEEVLANISELVDQEHELQSRSHEGEGLSEDDARRLQLVEAQLDQCWDLLRQRRARRHAGQDPDGATVRDVDTVEHYRQ